MKTLCILSPALILCMLMAIGCTAEQLNKSSEGLSADELYVDDDYFFSANPLQLEDLPPFRFDEPLFYVKPFVLNAEPFLPSLEVNGLQPAGQTEEAVERIIEGYRVQIFSGREENFARSIETELKEKFDFAVYLNYEAPQYKVRLGDFQFREDAVETCRILQENGYKDAWVVRSRVKSR